MASYLTFRNRNHNITTDNVTKIALSSLDDKRYLLTNSPNTLSYGHWRIRHLEHSSVNVARIADCTECFSYWYAA